MRENGTLQAAACLAIVGSAAAIYFCTSGGFGVGIDRRPHQATGAVMAQQALALIKPGGQLVIIARDTAAFKNPASDIQLASFRREVSKVRAIIGSVHALQVDPLRPLEVPAGDFFDLLRKATPADVIVSFMGPPLLTETQRRQLPEARPAVVAFCPGTLPEQVDLRLLFEQGLLNAAVIANAKKAKSGPRPSTLRQCFDQSFLLITHSNLAMLSTPTP